MPTQFRLNFLREFAVYRDMEHVVLPPSCRRVVTLAARKRRELHRDWVRATLWPADRSLVVDRQSVALAPHVRVDWHQAVRLIGRPPAARTGVDPKLQHPLRHGDLLDGWTDSWCAAERASYRRLRRAALEIASSP